MLWLRFSEYVYILIGFVLLFSVTVYDLNWAASKWYGSILTINELVRQRPEHKHCYIDGLVQDCSISIVNTLGTKSSI